MSIATSKNANIKDLIEKVNKDRAPITIVDDDGLSAVVISTEDFESMNETIHLLSSKANAKWIYESIKEADNNQTKLFRIEELEKMADEYKFTNKAFEDFSYWLSYDKRKVNIILELIKDIQKHPFEGIGKP